MTIRMLQAWNGLPEQLVTTLSGGEESRLVGLGLASFDLDGPADNVRMAQIATDAGGNVFGMVVNTIADLKALSAGQFLSVQVMGYYAAGDGGGDIFRWNSASTASDNGGTVIIPNSAPGTGRWERVYQAIDVKKFGAKGDGITDDTAAIQAAVDAINAAGGGTAMFPAGSYKFRGITPRSNVWYQCIGGAKFIPKIDVSDPNFYGFFVAGATPVVENVRFINCRFDFQGDLYPSSAGNPSAPLERGINCRGVKDWVFKNCDFYNNPGRQSIWLSNNSDPANVENVLVDGCSFRTFGTAVTGNVNQTDHSCIYIQGIGTRVVGNYFANQVSETVSTCAELHGKDITCESNVMRNANIGVIVSAIYSNLNSVNVMGNSMDNVRVGVSIWQGNNFIPYDINISGNVISGYTHYAISTFQGNAASTFGQGGGFAYGENLTIAGNSIRYASGAVVDTGAFLGTGIKLHYFKCVKIDGNAFFRVNGRGIVINQLGGAEQDFHIQNNKFYFNETATSSAQKYGMMLGDGVSTLNFVVVQGNQVSDSFTYGYYSDKVGNARFVQNISYAGTAAILADHRQASLFIDHAGDCNGYDYSGYSGIELGTRIFDKSTNILWIRKKSTSPFPMNKETWLDVAPTSGTWAYGDISWDSDAGAGTQVGYICTVGGTPGTWKTFGTIAV